MAVVGTPRCTVQQWLGILAGAGNTEHVLDISEVRHESLQCQPLQPPALWKL
jgi:hypothetical protein